MLFFSFVRVRIMYVRWLLEFCAPFRALFKSARIVRVLVNPQQEKMQGKIFCLSLFNKLK